MLKLAKLGWFEGNGFAARIIVMIKGEIIEVMISYICLCIRFSMDGGPQSIVSRKGGEGGEGLKTFGAMTKNGYA